MLFATCNRRERSGIVVQEIAPYFKDSHGAGCSESSAARTVRVAREGTLRLAHR
jgi:hypothetical protein